jgi:5-dehydro-4-deoxyglucarate dehydratase
MILTGVLFFPVTPFTVDDAVDTKLLDQHIRSRLSFSPGGVFPACGTGEFHALSSAEVARVVETTVDAVEGRAPVIAGAGGQLGHARECARAASAAGADALLVLPPYMVAGPTTGLVRYVEEILAATDLPVIVYHRSTAQYTVAAMLELAENPRVIGFKDGTGDLGVAQAIVATITDAGRDDFLFFNGLLTAELTQGAYRGAGIPLYSSAAFAMIPEVASAYYDAYERGDEVLRRRFISEFYLPLVALRDETPGFGVSLIKAGLRLNGFPAGSVRAPLVDPTPAQEAKLQGILDVGRNLVRTT